MLIAIVFEDTLTSDSQLWGKFIETAKGLGYRVVCVSEKLNTQENRDWIDRWMVMHDVRLPVFLTGPESKFEYMKRYGYAVGIWIDGRQEIVQKSKASKEITRTNAGIVCDVDRGPCACGAWH